MKEIYILSLLVAVSHNYNMDTEFCAKVFNRTHRHDNLVAEPPLYPDFHLNIESTIYTENRVELNTIWYSTTHDMFQRESRTKNSTERQILLPAKDKIYFYSKATNGDDQDCDSSSLEHLRYAKVFDLEDPKTHKWRLPAVPYTTPSIQRTPPVYLGKTTLRGIPAEEWFICSVDEANATRAGYVFYSDDGVAMPGAVGRVPLGIDYQYIQGNTVGKERYDFYMFEDKVNPKDKDMEIPAGIYCTNGTSANSEMPKPANACQFESINKNLGNIRAVHRATPTLEFSKVVYDQKFAIYVRDRETVGSDIMTAFRSRIVHDYYTGLEYDINLSTGKCNVRKITSSSRDVKEVHFGSVSMAKPKEFFNLAKGNYQYMGKHRYLDRDIEADVYTKVTNMSFDLTITDTYWVATTDFLKQMGLNQHEFVPLRMRTEQKTGDSMITNEDDIFHFTSHLSLATLSPDLSPCYSAGNEIYLDIVLKGQYKVLYSTNPDSFQRAFASAMIKYSWILSPIRVASFRVSPTDKGNTRVQFTLLDKPSMMGNSETEEPEPGNDVIWSKLKHSLESSTFQVSVHNELGHHIAKAIRYGKDFQDSATFNAKKANLKAVSDQSSRYGPGSMAGIGLGMLLLGLLAGFGILKGCKRYLHQDPDHIGLQEFKNDA